MTVAVEALGPWGMKGKGLETPILRSDAGRMIHHSIVSYEKTAARRQHNPLVRLVTSDYESLFSLSSDQGVIQDRFNLYVLAPDDLQDVGFRTMREKGLRDENYVLMLTPDGEHEIRLYPASPLVSFERTVCLEKGKYDHVKWLVRDTSSAKDFERELITQGVKASALDGKARALLSTPAGSGESFQDAMFEVLGELGFGEAKPLGDEIGDAGRIKVESFVSGNPSMKNLSVQRRTVYLYEGGREKLAQVVWRIPEKIQHPTLQETEYR